MFKYLKKSYILGIVSYFGPETASGGVETVENVKDNNDNGTNIDELYKKLTELALKENKTEEEKILLKSIGKQMLEERKRIDTLQGEEKQKVLEISRQSQLNYGNELYNNAQTREANKKQQEMIAKTMQEVKEFNNILREKAEQFINFANNNPSLKELGISLKIENGKIKISNGNWFSIPTMRADGSINHDENLSRLSDIREGFKDFVKEYIPDVKTFEEIGQENLAKEEEQEKIAALDKEVRKWNKNVLLNAEKGIDYVKRNLKLPEGIDLILNGDQIQIINNNKGGYIEKFFTLNLKDTNGEELNIDNKGKHVNGILQNWVQKVIKDKQLG